MIGRLIKLSLIVVGWYLVWPALASSAQTQCAVTFGFTDETRLSGVLLDIDYAGAAGGFIGAADSVECYSHVDGALTTFNNITDWELLKAAVVRIEGFGGAELFTCFFSGLKPHGSDFVVETVDATASDLTAVEPAPAVGVTAIDCSGAVSPDQLADPAGDPTAGRLPPVTSHGCELAVIAHSDVPTSGLVVEIGYSGAPATVAGVGDQAQCETRVPGALAAFNNIGQQSKLVAAVVHVEGVSGAVEIAECYLDVLATPQAGDFEVTVTEAVAPDGSALEVLPSIELAVYCGGEGVDDGGDADDPAKDGDGGLADTHNGGSIGGDCGPGPYDVVFGIKTPYAVGSLQLAIDYAGAPGEIVGSGDSVACTTVGDASTGFAAFNDVDALEKINVGFVSIEGVSTGEFVSCRFEADQYAPAADDFRATVIDATTPGVEPIYPLPLLTVIEIAPAADHTGCAVVEPVCGNGEIEEGEACDDGNDSNADACLNDCTVATCGDGYVLAGRETCDDGNDSNSDGCLDDCQPASCGDGYIHGGVEDCDRGAANSDTAVDACRSDCTLATCGDGVADSGEQCDDGNDDNSDACLSDCWRAWCGDGYVLAGYEACDEGAGNNDADPDSCRRDCSLPEVCGDADGNGVVNATDAKAVLDGAIGLSLSCARSRCDVDGSSTVTATDARLVLTASIGLGGDLGCWLPVVVALDDDVSVGALQFVVDYAATGSTFVGNADNVYCASLVENETFASYNNDPEAGLLHVALVSIEPIEGPAPLLACSFYQDGEEFVPEDFIVTVIDAADPLADPMELPALSVEY